MCSTKNESKTFIPTFNGFYLFVLNISSSTVSRLGMGSYLTINYFAFCNCYFSVTIIVATVISKYQVGPITNHGNWTNFSWTMVLFVVYILLSVLSMSFKNNLLVIKNSLSITSLYATIMCFSSTKAIVFIKSDNPICKHNVFYLYKKRNCWHCALNCCNCDVSLWPKWKYGNCCLFQQNILIYLIYMLIL